MSQLARLSYRFRQFRLAFFGPWQPVPEETLSPHLSQSLMTLFRRMDLSEQAHSLAVLQRLQAGGQSDPDLLATALLHDIGKTQSPLSVIDRALIVLGKRFFPRLAVRWGAGDLHGWTRPFVVAACHPAWGASLAADFGASPRLCDLIRRHQDASPGDDPLLLALQGADDFE
jgi:hypothetical protein